MKVSPTLLLVCLLPGFVAAAVEPNPEQSVQVVFEELRAVKPMRPGQTYTVQVGATTESGVKEGFLRRRTASEIKASHLSSGCGDYAMLFIEHMQALGFETLLVDGAEISSASLQNRFSGHAVVAVRAKDTEPWWLVDSTNLKILSRSWSLSETNFQAFGHVFWIGYCGPLAKYPVQNAVDLKAFYSRTLAAVPPDFYNRTLSRMKFTVHPSLVGPEGKFLNPRLERFLRLQDEILAAYHITPEREVAILLTLGEDSASSDLKYTEAAGWVSRVGLRSGCSPSLLAYFERTIRQRE